ncbi:Scr1 family TA system antitoxin-like transcriptional regulator [Micromonospora sp. NPDC050397]|uniref:Scr1 family TA system antitoxin-like transcriptional regulator n=1 Tax=Micromonospora sp. NPDC050397 TaxID=3364279 RepID=UPI00384BB703
MSSSVQPPDRAAGAPVRIEAAAVLRHHRRSPPTTGVDSREVSSAVQCTHLVRLAERPHVHIQVVPADAGAQAGLAGGFIMTMDPLSEAVHLDDSLQPRVVFQQADIDTPQSMWRAILRYHGRPHPPSTYSRKW